MKKIAIGLLLVVGLIGFQSVRAQTIDPEPIDPPVTVSLLDQYRAAILQLISLLQEQVKILQAQLAEQQAESEVIRGRVDRLSTPVVLPPEAQTPAPSPPAIRGPGPGPATP